MHLAERWIRFSGAKYRVMRGAHESRAEIVWYTGRLWRPMTCGRRGCGAVCRSTCAIAAAAAFWSDEQAALEQAEAVALIARQIKFRPKSVLSLPVEKKARHLAGMAQVSDLLAARLLIAYHLEHQRPMMGTFLDALGIKHEEGLITEESPPAPTPETTRRGRESAGGGVSQGRRRALLLDPDLAGFGDVGRSAGTARAGNLSLHSSRLFDATVRETSVHLLQPAGAWPSARIAAIPSGRTGCRRRSRRRSPSAASTKQRARQQVRLPRPVRARADGCGLPRHGVVRAGHRSRCQRDCRSPYRRRRAGGAAAAAGCVRQYANVSTQASQTGASGRLGPPDHV